PDSKGSYLIFDEEKSSFVRFKKNDQIKIKSSAYIFYKTLPDKLITIKELLRFSFSQVWFRDILIIVLTGAAGGLLGLLPPILTGFMFDNVIPSSDKIGLFQVGIFFIINAWALFIFNLTKSVSLLRVETKVDMSIMSAIWDRIISLPVPFFRNFSAGDITNRAESIGEIRRYLSGTAITSIITGVFSIFNFLVLFYYSLNLALISLFLIIIILAVSFIFINLSVKNQKKISELEGKLSSFIFQIIGGISKIKVSNSEKRVFSLWSSIFSQKRRFKYKLESFIHIYDIFYFSIPVLSLIIMFYIITTIKTYNMKLGDFIAFLTSFTIILTAILDLSRTFIDMSFIVPTIERIKPILETPSEIDKTKNIKHTIEGKIELNHVDFQYPSNSSKVLNDISLSINPGEFAAIVGASGSGKSTILRLLLGFEKPLSGAIYYDNKNLSTLNIH
ncbi:MAG TPA: ABC transporter transmembrane domain-containing protein, partial [Spirochaetota bacterium]|nr:ABC transporter transmembrane domain-containing protein [Spirochaetota bacterium]